MSKPTKFFLIAIIALAAFLRFFALDRIPPGIYPDEAMNGTNGLDALDAARPLLFYPDNNGREGLFINIVGISLKTFGVNQFGLRFPSALFGTLTVLGLFFLTRELLVSRGVIPAEAGIQAPGSRIPSGILGTGKPGMTSSERIALLAAFLLATSYWHVNFSRISFRAIMVPLLLTWSFYFVLLSFRKSAEEQRPSTNKSTTPDGREIFLTSGGSPQFNLGGVIASPPCGRKIFCAAGVLALLGGALFGLGFHTYIAYRIAPLLLAVLLFFKRREIFSTPRMRTATAIALIAAFLVALPMGVYFFRHRNDFLKREGAKVGVFDQERPLKALASSVAKTAIMFNIWGDCNWRHNLPCRPQLGYIVGLFFLIGLWTTLRNLKTKNYNPSTPLRAGLKTENYFLLAWLFIMLLPEVLTAEGIPHALRAIGAIIPAYMLAAIGANWVYERFVIPAKAGIQNLLESETLRSRRPGSRMIHVIKDYGISGMTIKPAVFFIVLLAAASLTTRDYFFVWAKTPQAKEEFTHRYTEIAEYVKRLPPHASKYIIVNRGDVLVGAVSTHAQTIKLLLRPYADIASSVIYIAPNRLEKIVESASPGSVIIPLYPDEQVFDDLEKQNLRVRIAATEGFLVGMVE